jgi:DNA topoisomerase-1
LIYLDEQTPGITRRLLRGHWAYFLPDGTRITDRAEIDRLNAIALPPAYRDCWFSPDPCAHLLATGIDARGRKQYRYHADWRAERDARKFDLCAAFGERLPVLRQRVAADSRKRGVTRERAIASVIALLDTGEIRVGNECYVRANRSFGATTLRMRHAKIEGRTLRLRFRAKSGLLREIACTDAAVLRFIRKMQDLPGQHLFQYLDPGGNEIAPVTSTDVNAYIHETMGGEFTARNFRTWAASALAFGELWRDPAQPLKALLGTVSSRLGNTPTIAGKSYVHPLVMAAARGGEGAPALPHRLPRQTRWLSREERGLIAFLLAH